jgi:hypothetical protein
MKPCHARPSRIISRRRLRGYVAALAGVCVGLLSPALSAHAVQPPAVPDGLDVGGGYKIIRRLHAAGTQNYVCKRTQTPPGIGWVLFGPQATLFTDYKHQAATHFLSPNPEEGGTPRPTWRDSRDSSTVWAMPVKSSSDPAYVEPGAVAWVLLRAMGRQAGPYGGRKLSRTAYLQRINTSGGLAPATGCSDDTNLGATTLVPYSADYVFYKATGRD